VLRVCPIRQINLRHVFVVQASVLNLLDARASDIQYYYASRPPVRRPGAPPTSISIPWSLDNCVFR